MWPNYQVLVVILVLLALLQPKATAYVPCRLTQLGKHALILFLLQIRAIWLKIMHALAQICANTHHPQPPSLCLHDWHHC
jgi:hypothetical protein